MTLAIQKFQPMLLTCWATEGTAVALSLGVSVIGCLGSFKGTLAPWGAAQKKSARETAGRAEFKGHRGRADEGGGRAVERVARPNA